MKGILAEAMREGGLIPPSLPRMVVRAERELFPFLAACLLEAHPGPLVMVVPDPEVDESFAFLSRFLGREMVETLAFREIHIAGERGEDPESVALRGRALRSLAEGEEKVVVLGAEAFRRRFPSMRSPKSISVKLGETLDWEETLGRLSDMGYEREYLVEGAGQFAVRGSIIDVFDPGHPWPVRIELFGDTVDRLRYFHPVDQRSLESLEEVEIFPVKTWGEEEEELLTLLSENALLVWTQPFILKESLAGEWGGLLERASDRRVAQVFLDPFASQCHVSLDTVGIPRYQGRVDEFLTDLASLRREGWQVHLILASEGRMRRMEEILAENEVPYSKEAPSDDAVVLSVEEWTGGFKLPGRKVAFLTEAEIFGLSSRRWIPAKPPSGQPVEGWWDLKEGDFVVHLHHGVAVYGGLVRRQVDGADREYLLLKYAEGDVLYVPTDRIDLVHRYVGADKPTIHRLSSPHWRRVTRKARASAKKMAIDLLQLYAERMAAEGHAFSPDDVWQWELESSFPYVETPDQEKAIREVKEDMERPVPMDRLVYGDVGYGKTEVAVRAAFKAVMDGKQVAVLVPTTVLAQQHLRTFRERYSSFPVRVEALSRFQSPAEQRAILDDLARGKVDVIIGTHRLLQDDVAFFDLGLVIIDEEHRFGVEQKEKFKTLRRNVDVLTLTATPIPRTLQMSLSGIRDMSIIDTPIQDRQAVITMVSPWRDELVQEAVRRELARGGQVFFVHNRINTLPLVARKVKELVPEARVVMGHGQMRERELERVMADFVEGRADVLVCTTIVESGLDIPNANTLIVDGAERLGLSQLYHLRGRVGRSDRQAFALFLFGEGAPLTDGALQRLKVIRDFSELGSGLRVAMKDLEIRGAGNLLGPEQHGHVEAVGFELYCRMLAEAVDSLRGVRRPRSSEVTIDLPLAVFIPEEYIEKTPRRVEVYRRLAEAPDPEAVDVLKSEVRDRYGPLPPETEHLFEASKLRFTCRALGIREVGHAADTVVLKLNARGARKWKDYLEVAAGGGYPFRHALYHRAYQEIRLPYPRGSWRIAGRDNLMALISFLKDVQSAGKGRMVRVAEKETRCKRVARERAGGKKPGGGRSYPKGTSHLEA